MRINFTSKKLAFYLIALILAFIILSAIIPQKNFAEERIINWQELLGENYRIIEMLWLDRIYYNPAFFLILGIFAVNLAAANIKRFKIVYKVERTLLRVKHIGSIVFHLSLLIIIIGVILNYLYKYNGIFAVTEGQTVTDSSDSYFRIFRGPLYSGDDNRFKLTLESFDQDFPVEGAKTEAANIIVEKLPELSRTTETIMTNRPYKWQNLEFHYGLISGYSPRMIFSDTLGKNYMESFIRLATQKISDELQYRDFVIFPENKLKIDIEVLPNVNSAEQPEYAIIVENDEQIIYQGTIKTGEAVSFDRYNLIITDCRRWCYIDVVESPFLNLVFAGFWSALAGLLIGFFAQIKNRQRNQS